MLTSAAAHTVIMAVKKAYNHENELLACRPSPEVMIQIFCPAMPPYILWLATFIESIGN